MPCVTNLIPIYFDTSYLFTLVIRVFLRKQSFKLLCLRWNSHTIINPNKKVEVAVAFKHYTKRFGGICCSGFNELQRPSKQDEDRGKMLKCHTPQQ